MKNKKPLLNEFQLSVLETIINTPGISKSQLYDGRTEQKYVESLLTDDIICETKHGLNNRKTIKVTEKGMKIFETAQRLLALINDEGEDETNYGSSPLKGNKVA